MILHAIVADAQSARWAAGHGATVVQLRLKGVTTAERVRVGGEVVASLHDPVIVVMNDDVEAAAALGVAVHLGQGDPGTEAARREGIPFGRSAATVLEAREAEASRALYVGAGAVWPTPSKSDTGPPIGLDGLSAICAAVRIPVVAIGGVDSGNAGLCIAAGASGVAVIRGVAELPRLRAILDSALAPGVRERG